MAEDKDGDVLTYTLATGNTGADVFAIDWATGQLMTKGALNFEGGIVTATCHGQGDGPGGRTPWQPVADCRT